MGKKREEVFAQLSDEPVDFSDIAREGAKEMARPEEDAAAEQAPVPQLETEPKPEVTPPKEPEPKEESLPFHRHPKWIRTTRENEELRKKLEEIEARLGQQPASQPKQEAVPEEYRHVFGEDYEAYKAFADFSRKQAESILSERERRAAEEKERTKKEEQEFMRWADERFAELSTEAGTDLTVAGNPLREKLLDAVEENDLYDRQGRPNLRAALAYVRMSDATSQSAEKAARQALAATASAPRTAGAAQKGGPMTPSRLRSRSIDDYFKD